MKPLLLFLLLFSPLAQAQEWSELAARALKPDKTWSPSIKIPATGQAQVTRALQLDGQGLSHIPKEIGECVNLEYLNLAENALALDTADLAVLAKLPKLQVLILTGNRITGLTPEFFKVEALANLRQLVADKNEIAVVSASITNLTHLELLSLNQNPLHTLPDDLGKLANLKMFQANSCNLGKWPEGEFKSLEFLALPGNDLKIDSLSGFPANLKTLVLTRNSITRLTLKEGGKKLTSLVLSDDLREHVEKAGRTDITITWEK